MTAEGEKRLSKQTYNALCKLFDEMKWSYYKDEEKLLISGRAIGEDLNIPFTMIVDDDKMLLTLVSHLPFNIPVEYRVEATIAIAKINYRLSDGNFDINLDDGSVLFRLTSSFRESIIGAELFKYMFLCACFTVDDYNDKLLNIANGTKNADNFLE